MSGLCDCYSNSQSAPSLRSDPAKIKRKQKTLICILSRTQGEMNKPKIFCLKTVADPGSIIWPIFRKNCMKIKKFWARGGRPSRPPLDPPLENVKAFLPKLLRSVLDMEGGVRHLNSDQWRIQDSPQYFPDCRFSSQ